MRVLVAALLVFTFLAGCGDKVSYPDSFLLDVEDAPDGLLLLKPGMAGWDDYTEATGATTNPSSVEPAFISEVLGTPEPTDAHGAVYVTLGGGILISAVVGMPDNDEAKDWLRDQILDRCLGGIRLLIKDDHLSILGAFGVPQEDVDAAAKAVKKASKSSDLCREAFDAATADAARLDLGSNGPYAMDTERWFLVDLAQDARVRFLLDATANVQFSIHGEDLANLYDATDDDLIAELELDRGDYFVRVAPRGGSASDSFSLDLEAA